VTAHTAALLAVFGTASLTVGTAAQAITNLVDFGKYAKAASKEVLDAARQGGRTTAALLKRPILSIILTLLPGIQVVFIAVSAVALRRGIAKIRGQNADDARQIVSFLLAALFWTVIMVGSALTLIATKIQLDLTPG
jgi:hypothetical protein